LRPTNPLCTPGKMISAAGIEGIAASITLPKIPGSARDRKPSLNLCLSLLCAQESEHQFQPKLNLAGTRDCARDLARRGTDAIARKDEEVRNPEVCPVGDIEGFSTEQHFRPFRDWDGLEDRDIDLRQARPIQHSAADASPGP